jgi:hypothetical protein
MAGGLVTDGSSLRTAPGSETRAVWRARPKRNAPLVWQQTAAVMVAVVHAAPVCARRGTRIRLAGRRWKCNSRSEPCRPARAASIAQTAFIARARVIGGPLALTLHALEFCSRRAWPRAAMAGAPAGTPSRQQLHTARTVDNTPLPVLYADAHLLAVDKPYDVAMSGADHAVLLDALVARWVGPGWHYAHQIDMATSGCVLYTG